MSERERIAGNWLAGFGFFTRESEAPNNYLYWAGMSTIAGAIQRHVKFRWNYHDIYPNLYVLLVGPAGNYKSQTIRFTSGFLQRVKVETASEAMTKEGLILQMTQLAKDEISAVTILSSDLMSFFRPSQGSMIEFLTDIFDCPDLWRYTIRNRPPDILKNAYVNFMGGTTPSWMSENFSVSFTEQGFAARTLFVYADSPRFRRADAKISSEMWAMYEALVQDLEHITTLKGDFSVAPDAWEWFRDWYEGDSLSETIDYRLQGYLVRKPLHLWKVAMILSLAQKDELVIDLPTIQLAKQQLDILEPDMVRAFQAVGKNPIAMDMQRIWDELKQAGSMTKAEIVMRNRHALRKQEIDEVLDNLSLMGWVQVNMAQNGLITYTVKEQK